MYLISEKKKIKRLNQQTSIRRQISVFPLRDLLTGRFGSNIRLIRLFVARKILSRQFPTGEIRLGGISCLWSLPSSSWCSLMFVDYNSISYSFSWSVDDRDVVRDAVLVVGLGNWWEMVKRYWVIRSGGMRDLRLSSAFCGEEVGGASANLESTGKFIILTLIKIQIMFGGRLHKQSFQCTQ
jgi:hypothetical protein